MANGLLILTVLLCVALVTTFVLISFFTVSVVFGTTLIVIEVVAVSWPVFIFVSFLFSLFFFLSLLVFLRISVSTFFGAGFTVTVFVFIDGPLSFSLLYN